MTFTENIIILCKNVVGIIRNLETNFIRDVIMNSHYNIVQQLSNLITLSIKK